MKLSAVYIDDYYPDENFYRQAVALLSGERARKLEKLHFAEDRVRSMLGELLLRINLKQVWGIGSGEIRFVYNEYGKPRLERHPQLHFNLTHSGRWVAAAIDEAPVGVDVEQIKPVDMGIAERFFTPSEQQYIQGETDGNKLTSFYRIWTLKESYIKAKGKGLSIPLNRFSVELANEQIHVKDFMGEDKAAWFFKSYEDLPGYAMAVCSAQSSIPDQVECKSLQEIQSELLMLSEI